MSTRSISDYALLSDCHGAALVSRAGSIDWLCLRRFDSPAVFARLLGEDAGHWSITPRGETTVSRRYRDATMVLETTFSTPSGELVLDDALAVGVGETGHELGTGAPHALLRRVRCVRGRVSLAMEYAPRPEYGLVHPILARVDGGIYGRGGASVLLLSSDVSVEIANGCACAEFELGAGDRACFALQHAATWESPPAPWSAAAVEYRLDDTERAWRSWSAMHQNYEGPWRDLVHHSGRVLQALTFYPTGAIVAAPTTSLPEVIGGERNWDYRFTWVRDASLTIEALWVAACPDEAHRFFEFLSGCALTQIQRSGDLQIMFGVGGEHDLSERELPHLPGWRASHPVRIGNAAWGQRQLDVYGELIGAVHRLADQLERLDRTTRAFLVGVVEAAGARWPEKDHGIWEVRGEPRHFLHSKLMCWVALDRGVALAEFLGAVDRAEHWREIRERVRRAIEDEGWSDRARSFTQTFGGDDLDASCLLIPIVGFLPSDDPRVLATIDAIEEQLTDPRGLVYRYRVHDGLPGQEGSFLLCTFWLAEALALSGRLTRARATFERAISFASDLGLLAEEVAPDGQELLGNFPQAFSHIGLVNAAWAISRAELAHLAAVGAPRCL